MENANRLSVGLIGRTTVGGVRLVGIDSYASNDISRNENTSFLVDAAIVAA